MLDAARGAATATATARRRRDGGETAARYDGEIRRQIFGETAYVLFRPCRSREPGRGSQARTGHFLLASTVSL